MALIVFAPIQSPIMDLGFQVLGEHPLRVQRARLRGLRLHVNECAPNGCASRPLRRQTSAPSLQRGGERVIFLGKTGESQGSATVTILTAQFASSFDSILVVL